MAQDPVIIVGAGHAGFQLAASLRQHGFEGGIALVGDEPVLPYQRPPLSKEYLDGKIGLDLLLPPPSGIELDGVCYLRTLAETDLLRARLAAAENVVVIGAGFIGLEFAAIAREHGKHVHIVELTERAMGRVLSVESSRFFAKAHRATGVVFSFGAQVMRIAGHTTSPMGGRVDH